MMYDYIIFSKDFDKQPEWYLEEPDFSGYYFDQYNINGLTLICQKNYDQVEVTIKGSLLKYFSTKNPTSLGYEDFRNVIKELENEIGIKLRNWDVRFFNTLDFIPVNEPVHNYLLNFYYRKKMNCNVFNFYQGIEYFNKLFKLKFFDLNKDISKRRLFSENYHKKNKNILGIELVPKEIVMEIFEKKRLKVKDLMNKKNYKELVKIVYRNYKLIKKISFTWNSSLNGSTPTKVTEGLARQGIASIGADASKSLYNNSNNTTTQNGNIKKKIVELTNTVLGETAILNTELDRKMKKLFRRNMRQFKDGKT